MKHELRLFFVALQFLTRAPAPRWVGFEPAWLRACPRHFPLVGTFVGMCAAVVFVAALALWPPLVASVLSLAATAWLTGAFHEDGLADTADALGGAVDRERALSIMKDSRIGSYGAVALVLACLLKVTAVAALADAGPRGTAWAALALVWSHTSSRAAPGWIASRLPYAGSVQASKAQALTAQVASSGFWIGLGWVAIVSVAVIALAAWSGAAPPSSALFALLGAGAAAVAVTVLCQRWLRRRLGGYTGDTLGATQQLVELAGLLAWLAASGAHHA